MTPKSFEQFRKYVEEELLNDSSSQMGRMILEEWRKEEEGDGSSTKKKSRRYLNRDREGGYERLFNDVNGTMYTKGYYLADGIYLEWATLVKSFSHPEDPKRLKFKQMQEATRKDVERAFGLLQSRWAIIRGPARFWYKSFLREIMYTCIILHNMIVENEGDVIANWDDDEREAPDPIFEGFHQDFQQYLIRNAELRDREVHHRLRSDLVEHIWNHFEDVEEEN